MVINEYSIGGYWCLMTIILVTIGLYFIDGYYCLLMVIVLMAIGGYYINGYWLLLYK
jgi:hypothetical protein